jgi:formylglycine-generating enzyme required for sulfatase activity
MVLGSEMAASSGLRSECPLRLLTSLVLLLVLPAVAAARSSDPVVAVEIETRENTLDGCMDCGCRTRGQLELRREGSWWVAFGLVGSGEREAWPAEGSSSRCGVGSFDQVAADFRQTIGTPYVVLDLSLTATARGRGGEVDLDMIVGTQKLSGFDEQGRGVYRSSTQTRSLTFADAGSVTLPVLIPDEREKLSFGVHEVLLRLRATASRRKPRAAYGEVSVSADVPGAEVLLDGGLVGRIPEGRPLVVRNVPVGQREIRVRDLSGREAERRVAVKKNKTSDVTLELLELSGDGPGKALVPIGRNPQGYEELWRAQDGAIVVRIPAGEFLRGSAEDEGEPHERPQRRLYISEFLIDKTEVTWRQFRKYAVATGAQLPPAPLWGTPDDYPASPIVWEEARGYCEWVGGRLPTEAEWEKAARGTDGRKYPWGEEWDHDRCNSRDGGPHRPVSAGSYRECLSPYGVLDMAGNVWEWCSDAYEENYYAESPPKDPPGPETGPTRVLRGGAWITAARWLRAAYRYKVSPTYRNTHYGLRCVLNPPGS